ASQTSWDPNVTAVASGATLSNGNVTLVQLKDASGAIVQQTSTSYQTAAAYLNQAMSHLPLSRVVKDGSGAIFSRHDVLYDEVALTPSGQTGLDATYTGSARGNATTARSFTDPANGLGAVDSRTYYFDNGSVQSTQSPNDLAAGRFTQTTASNFGACSSNPE